MKEEKKVSKIKISRKRKKGNKTQKLKYMHPPPDTPQKKNQKTHLRDPQIYQVEGIDIPKQKVAISSESRFFNKINSKTL